MQNHNGAGASCVVLRIDTQCRYRYAYTVANEGAHRFICHFMVFPCSLFLSFQLFRQRAPFPFSAAFSIVPITFFHHIGSFDRKTAIYSKPIYPFIGGSSESNATSGAPAHPTLYPQISPRSRKNIFIGALVNFSIFPHSLISSRIRSRDENRIISSEATQK